MTRPPPRDIAFAWLPPIPPDTIAAHMSDPRVAAHMPLLAGPWDRAAAAAFVTAKEAHWQRDGLGHWAILCDGRYAGWGGFQKEGGDWDFGLVLRPDAFARADDRIHYVTFLLPPSRQRLSALARLGARPVGEVDYEGARFRKFRLETG